MARGEVRSHRLHEPLEDSPRRLATTVPDAVAHLPGKVEHRRELAERLHRGGVRYPAEDAYAIYGGGRTHELLGPRSGGGVGKLLGVVDAGAPAGIITRAHLAHGHSPHRAPSVAVRGSLSSQWAAQ